MVDVNEHCLGGADIVVIDSQLILDHLINAVFERRSAILVLHSDQMVLGTLDIDYKVFDLICWPVLLMDLSCKLKYLLLGDRNGICMI